MAATEQEKIPVIGTLVTGVPGGQVVDTDNIRDPNLNDRTQSDINAEALGKKTWAAYDSYTDLPVVGNTNTLYFTRDNGYIWEYSVSNGYTILSDNWRSLKAINGIIN